MNLACNNSTSTHVAIRTLDLPRTTQARTPSSGQASEPRQMLRHHQKPPPKPAELRSTGRVWAPSPTCAFSIRRDQAFAITCLICTDRRDHKIR
jgi:hypothetical protein